MSAPPIPLIRAKIIMPLLQEKIDNRTKEILMLTPKGAARFLELNTRNRKISQQTVNKLADKMAAGEWRYTGEDITINKNREITNGQHRLTACIKSGATIEIGVSYGVDNDAFTYQDQARTRGTGVKLAYDGVLNSKHVGAVCRLLAAATSNGIRYSASGTKKITPEACFYSLSPNAQDYLQDAIKIAALGRKNGFKPKAPDHFAIFLILSATSGEAKSDLIRAVTGEGVTGALFSLYSYRITDRVNGKYPTSTGRALEIIKAWLLATKGRKVTARTIYATGETLLDIHPAINGKFIDDLRGGKI